MWLRARLSIRGLIRDRSAVAAIEFAMVVPIMLVLFFGTVEFSSGVAVDRKVSLMAHTLSDLASQSPTTGVSDSDFVGFFAANAAIMQPYDTTPLKAVISELYVDGTTTPPQARVQWSKGYQGGTPLAAKTVVTVPGALLVGGTYLIYSQVNYLYTPTVGYVMSKAGINLSDVSYTRPRQSNCVIYPAVVPPTPIPPCPTS
ncbi:TadE/TadG family type IV pilus assembly protein [Bradyrhizobium canariense]|nr:TadE/TadG family type IV pilus assembly protein [Bradyrhizobium canariense]